MRKFLSLAAIFASIAGLPAFADEAPCVNIYHDESGSSPSDTSGPINTIMLANLLGHWPEYEIRVRPIFDYEGRDLEACKVTLYLGTDPESEIPSAFLGDFFLTGKRVAWIGFGQQQLDKKLFAGTFNHRVSGQVGAENRGSKDPHFYQFVSYKDRLFKKSVDVSDDGAEGAFEAVRFVPVNELAKDAVAATLVHNKSFQSIPYFLRAGSKHIVGDVPLSYMHEGDRYFAFADFLFDILDEKPIRATPWAFARTEDIHGQYETYLVEAALAAHDSEQVPFSVAHIPLFADPFDAFGGGAVKEPKAASDNAGFLSLVKKIQQDPDNTIVWHGVTHQYGEMKNPHSGTSGDDYEFWNMAEKKPIGEDSEVWTLDRLAQAMPVFAAYQRPPRFWVTPHYHASAVDARVFADVFPWTIGRVTYFPSSFGPAFTVPAAGRTVSLNMPAITADVLKGLKTKKREGMDLKSAGGLTQMFPFEIFRDVYGQRIVPETLGYMSYATSDQTSFTRTADDMLADARRNSVVRDYWASFFYHPYVFSKKEDGGIGRFGGDTLELRKLLIGLKLLGYKFTSLPEFEASLNTVGKMGAAETSTPMP